MPGYEKALERTTSHDRRSSAVSASSHGRRASSALTSKDRRFEPQGLSTIFTPVGSPAADIIFVHGLGGSSRMSWAKGYDMELFWPQRWLPLEDELSSTRIFTFGYDAHFNTQERKNFLSISDFAKDLLYQMRYPPDEGDSGEPLGKVYIAYPFIYPSFPILKPGG